MQVVLTILTAASSTQTSSKPAVRFLRKRTYVLHTTARTAQVIKTDPVASTAVLRPERGEVSDGGFFDGSAAIARTLRVLWCYTAM